MKEKVNVKTLQSALEEVLKANGYKQGTKKAQICETSFIKGAITADPSLITESPLLSICLMSGRSILSLNR